MSFDALFFFFQNQVNYEKMFFQFFIEKTKKK